MPRYKITIEYDGTPFVGWQIQADGSSVQGALTAAIKQFSSEDVTVKGAGRTDSGVHARGQVAHFDLAKDWDPVRVREATNHFLKPAPVVILDCEHVDATFDARFSATARHYLYKIMSRLAQPALKKNRVWWTPQTLDTHAMADAATVLLGRHDFTTFRASQCQAKSPVKTLDRLDVVEVGEEIHIYASARSFLHNQVRSMVGSLKLVGDGKWTKSDLAQALKSADRSACGTVAPAAGLYLMSVDYGPQDTQTTAADDIDDLA